MVGRLRRVGHAVAFTVGVAALGAVMVPGAASAAATPSFELAPRDSGSLSGRVFSAAASGADGETVVLYGGETPGSADVFADTWVYRPASGWTALCGSTAPGPTTPCGPGPRSDAVMASGPGGPVLFGGTVTGLDSGGTPVGSTWAFRDGSWSEVCADGACGPTGRLFPGMGGNGEQIVMFGGLSATGLPDDTWVFDGETWTQTCGASLPTPCGVPGLLGPTIGWDGQQFVMFGGAPMGASDLDPPTADTYVFDGTSWTQVCGAAVSTPCGPARRALAGIAWQRQPESSLQGALLVGGGSLFGASGGQQELLRDAWLWRAGAWTQVSTPWPSAPVTFTDGGDPGAGTGPLIPLVVAQPSSCQVLFVGQDPTAGAELTLQPQTFSGGWDLNGSGAPSGCTAQPAATPVTVPVAAPVEPAAAPAGTSAAAPSGMARTGSSSGLLAAIGAAALVVGLGAVVAARSWRPGPKVRSTG